MQRSATLPSIHPDDAAGSGADTVLLDVRDDTEWRFGHAPTAVHVPMRDLPGRVEELDRTKRIVCACRSGNRSARVTAWLLAQGFDAVNLAGGMSAWASFGHPLVMHDGRPGMVT